MWIGLPAAVTLEPDRADGGLLVQVGEQVRFGDRRLVARRRVVADLGLVLRRQSAVWVLEPVHEAVGEQAGYGGLTLSQQNGLARGLLTGVGVVDDDLGLAGRRKLEPHQPRAWFAESIQPGWVISGQGSPYPGPVAPSAPRLSIVDPSVNQNRPSSVRKPTPSSVTSSSTTVPSACTARSP